MGYSTVPMILSIIGTWSVRIIWIYGLFQATGRCFPVYMLSRFMDSDNHVQAICYLFIAEISQSYNRARKL